MGNFYNAFAALLLLNALIHLSNSREPLVWRNVKRDQNTGVSYAYFERYEMHSLSLPLMKNLTTMQDSSMDCSFICTRLAWCLSFNFQRSSGKDGKHRCEMLSSDKYRNSADFLRNKDFDHFIIPVSLLVLVYLVFVNSFI